MIYSVLAISSVLLNCFFQDMDDGSTPQLPQPESRILATVGEFSISEQAVLRSLKKTLPHFDFEADGKLKSLGPAQQQLFDGALAQLIDQQIVFDFLSREVKPVGSSELQLELDLLTNELKQMGLELSTFLKNEKMSQKELESEIGWKLIWPRYLKKALTDNYLEQHYNRNRPRFDGSQMHVAHLLIKTGESRNLDEATRIATRIREELKGREPEKWDRLVAENSETPTAGTGGDIGWIEYHKPMPVKFAEAAFQLKKGEVSQPVVTTFGVHLIRCVDIKPGKIQWRDALDQVREDATRKLFQQIADENRKNIKIARPIKGTSNAKYSMRGVKWGQAPLCQAPAGPFRQRYLTPFHPAHRIV